MITNTFVALSLENPRSISGLPTAVVMPSMTSGSGLLRVAMQGVPHAAASTAGRPNPSSNEGIASAVAPA